MYACKCFRPNVATPMAKKNKKRKKKLEKKIRLIAATVQKFSPTSNLLNEEKKSFICDIFRDICSSMVYLNNKNLKEKYSLEFRFKHCFFSPVFWENEGFFICYQVHFKFQGLREVVCIFIQLWANKVFFKLLNHAIFGRGTKQCF